MGQCYSVGLKIKVKHNSEEKAAEALRLHMLQDDKTEYNFESLLILESGQKNWMISSETALLDGNQALIAWKKFLAGKNIIMILMLAMDGTQL